MCDFLRFTHEAPSEEDDLFAQLVQPRPPLNETPVLGVKLTLEEISAAFGNTHPQILSLEEAAELAGWAPGTLKRKVSEGKFKSSVSRRRPLMFWRDRFVQEVMK